MRALVAGTGFIGTNLIKRLRDTYDIRAVYHTEKPNLDVECCQADLTSMEDCQRVVHGMDYVFMCAASTSGAAIFQSDPLSHVTPNVVMNANIMDASYRAGVKKFLFISSSAAYPPTDHPVKEEEMWGPDPYPIYYSVGWMKRYAETLCRTYALHLKNPMPTVVIRPSNSFGRHDKFDFERSHFTAALVRRVIEKQNPIVVWGDGTDLRDLIYIDDLIDGMLLAFNTELPYLAVNIASGQSYTVKQVLSTLLQIKNFHPEIRFDITKPRTIPAREIDISLAKSLGFAPKVSLADGLRKTLDWFECQSRN